MENTLAALNDLFNSTNQAMNDEILCTLWAGGVSLSESIDAELAMIATPLFSYDVPEATIPDDYVGFDHFCQ